MRKYEVMFIVRPTIEETAIKKVSEDIKSLFANNGANIIDMKDMGQKELAYEIKKFKKGYYFLLTVEAATEAINEFNHVSNVNEDIIRSLVVKIED